MFVNNTNNTQDCRYYAPTKIWMTINMRRL